MQSTEKKPLTAFTVISTIILLLLTVLFIFPFYWILTGAFKSQPDTIVIPPQWFPKMPTMENFQQLMVQNPALQWMWNSVFISLVTMFLVCATSSLAGYVLAKKTFLWSTHSICYLYRCYGASKTSCPCTIGTYRQLHGNPRYSLGSYLAFDWMAIRCLPHETVQ